MERKNVLVTGANGGIGRAIIKVMASKGFNIYAHARKLNAEFEAYLQKLEKEYSTKIMPVYFDLTDYETMKKEVSSLIKAAETIDVLVNNAGVAHGGFFAMTKIQTIKDIFEVNLFAAMELTHYILRKMTRQRSGCIINMSSIAAINVRPGNSAYGVSKAAIKAWTETLAAEVAGIGIRVNAVAPSLTDTRMATLMEEKAGEEMLLNSAMKRLARPEEIANVVAFLASEESSFVNGQTIIVNGGEGGVQ